MFTVTRHGVLAYVEYEDFMPEHTVRRELESLLGSGYLVSVKRECSRSLFKEIVDFLSSDTSGQKTPCCALPTVRRCPPWKYRRRKTSPHASASWNNGSAMQKPIAATG